MTKEKVFAVFPILLLGRYVQTTATTKKKKEQ